MKSNIISFSCDTNPRFEIFIAMKRKTRHLRVRLTEQQFRNLAEVLILEQKNKSSVIREALKKYIEKNHKDIINRKGEKNGK
jgi:hypothetical protein